MLTPNSTPTAAAVRAAAARASIVSLLLGACLALPAAAVTLYDPSAGTPPSSQGWSVLAAGAAAAESTAGGLYTLDTTGAGVSYYGNGRIAPLVLNTAVGFDLSFSLAVTSETHVDNTRSGYSVIVTGADPTHELELAFWSGNVWAYDYSAGSFVHGADVALDTGVLRSYTLSVRNQQYTLSSGGTLLLSGALKDYTAFGAPYSTPNFVFFGDDSSRGDSVTRLGLVTLVPVPEPAPAALFAAGLSLLAWRRRAR